MTAQAGNNARFFFFFDNGYGARQRTGCQKGYVAAQAFEYPEKLDPGAIQAAVSSGIDTSPEATANRILVGSTAFFEGYAAQHPGKDRDQLATDFVALIRGGFEAHFVNGETPPHPLAG
ncbi:MAG: DUF5610 domain-containing protein [Azoarcus sp.]|nr:DUF5610 domain-containing protein [Azoarcus sp.]